MSRTGVVAHLLGPESLPPARDIAAGAGLVIAATALWLGPGERIAAVVIVAFVGLILFSPLAGVWGIVAAVPFVYQPVAVGGASISLLELAILCTSASVGIRLVWETIRSRAPRCLLDWLKPWRFTLAAGALVLVAAYSLSRVADDRYLPESLRAFRLVIVEPVAAFFLFRFARRRGHLGSTLAVAVVVAAAVALVAVGQFLFGRDVVVVDGIRRATGPYPHPNNLAFYLERFAVFAFCLVLGARVRPTMLAPLAVVLGLGVLATVSRGAMLGVFAGSVWAWTILRPSRQVVWMAVAALATLVGIGLVAGSRLADTGAAGSTSSRELVWDASLNMLRDRPIDGVGLDQFLYQYGRRYVDPAGWPERYTSHPHNIVLDAWLSLGAAGLVVMAGVVAASVWSVSDRGALTPLAIGGGAALIAGFVHGMVDNGFFLPDLAVLTWLMIAVIEPGPSSPNPAAAPA